MAASGATGFMKGVIHPLYFKNQKKTGFQNMVGTFEYEFFRGGVHFF